jgi:hypothetical protein
LRFARCATVTLAGGDDTVAKAASGELIKLYNA